MPDAFIEAYKLLAEEFELVEESFSFQPSPLLRPVWNAFWDVRGTKPYEHPITFTDIQAYTSLMQITFPPTEIRLITGWDKLYYKYYTKYIL